MKNGCFGSRLALLALLGMTVSSNAAPPDESSRFDPDRRRPWTASRVVGSPEPPAPYRVERFLPKFSIKQPIFLQGEPGGTGSAVLVQHLGNWAGPSKLFRLDWADGSTQELLHLEQLVYSITFDPQYATNGYLYTFGNGDQGRGRIDFIMRHQLGRMGKTIDMSRSLVIAQWPSGGHDGGGIAFGNDGMLYLATGDGSGDSDGNNTGQSLDDLAAGILRIDVRNAQPGMPYLIPADNPFVGVPGARPELFAIGLRNPWRLCNDPVTGQLWAGSNGQDLWESVYLIARGANYGWPIQEGSQPFHVDRPRAGVPLVPSTVDHPHSAFRSLTGGLVYRGDKLPELQGVYVYGDFSTGEIWGARHDGTRLTMSRELARTTLQITAFAAGPDGELLVVDHAGGLYALKPTEPGRGGEGFPTKLSQTGIYRSTSGDEVDPALIPYDVNSPQWVDGASQRRFLGLTGESTLAFAEANGWDLPEGTVVVKTLSLEATPGDPTSARRVETQLLTRQDKEWAAYTYAWSDDQSDAELVAPEGRDAMLTLGGRSVPWRFGARNECLSCHSRAANYVLGITTPQLNRERSYGDRSINQIQLLLDLKVMPERPKRRPAEWSRLDDPADASRPLERRARSYLHANCASCHVEAGGGNAAFRLDFKEPIGQSRLLGVKPIHATFGLEDAALIVPGDPSRSVLLYRMLANGGARMPRVGSQVVDEAGVKLIKDWIAAMPADPMTLGRATARRRTVPASTDHALAATSTVMDWLFTPSGPPKPLLARAATHPNADARALLERFLPPEQRTKRLGGTFDPKIVLDRAGDAERGRQLFFSETVNCKGCHRVDAATDLVGPSLGGIGAKRDRPTLFESLIHPSKVIEPAYRSQVALLEDGSTRSGLLVRKTAEEVVLRPSVGPDERLPAASVQELTPTDVSLMPEGLLANLTAQEAADLLEFLATRK